MLSQFFIYARSADIAQEGNKSAGSKLTVERRVEFEGLLVQSRIHVAKLRHCLLNFWAVLSERVPSLTALQETGLEINSLMQLTDDTFKQLLALCPSSASVKRAYAEFLLVSD